MAQAFHRHAALRDAQLLREQHDAESGSGEAFSLRQDEKPAPPVYWMVDLMREENVREWLAAHWSPGTRRNGAVSKFGCLQKRFRKQSPEDSAGFPSGPPG
jgi:hypothetical protein